MEFKFYLNDVEVEEPIGFADLELSIIRDEQYHGIGFEASTSQLEFWGDGAQILKSAKNQYGINAMVIFRAEMLCNAYQEEENVYTGRVNFGTYTEKCGDSCTVSAGIEEDSCIVMLRNKMDQQIDVDSLVASDKLTPLADYVAMGEEIELPGINIDARVEGYILDGGQQDVISIGEETTPLQGFGMWVRPSYNNEVFNSINTGNLTGQTFSLVDNPDFFLPPSPQLLMEGSTQCFTQDFNYEFRFKGSLSIPVDAEGFNVIAFLMKWDALGAFQDAPQLHVESISSLEDYTSGQVINFDVTFSGSTPLLEGEALYGVIQVSAFNTDPAPPFDLTINWDEETMVLIQNINQCPTTTAQYYMIHEVLSRCVESVTNNCARVKSSYYGRTESQPFAFDEDGCGGLRMVTSGLKVRKAEHPYFFTSFKKLIDDLNAIDNIGFGLEDDPDIPNKKIVVIEKVDHFYEDEILLSLPAIPSAATVVNEEMYYSIIKIGYRKWEVERFNGLDEPNSTREYRTAFDTVNKALEMESDLVAGSYAWEVTRQQSWAATGAADTSMDNDTFIACLNRAGYNTFEVEVGEVSDSDNIYSPETKYNLRITPARNMLRWYRSVTNGYPSIFDTTNKIFFSSGTGNIAACIQLLNNAYMDECVDELMKLCESQDIFISNFSDSDRGIPIWKNETITFQYPLSISDYRMIKASPYKKIQFQCGGGDFEEGYIKEIKFSPVQGMGTFTLIKKY